MLYITATENILEHSTKEYLPQYCEIDSSTLKYLWNISKQIYSSIVLFCIRNYLVHFVQMMLNDVLLDNHLQKLNNFNICIQNQSTTPKLFLWYCRKWNQSHQTDIFINIRTLHKAISICAQTRLQASLMK
jgi:hypothetical protein